MKIVWLLNSVLPEIAEKEKFVNSGAGWTVQLADMLSDNKDIELTVFFPQSVKREAIRGNTGRLAYYGFYEPAIALTEYDRGLEDEFRAVIASIQPDLVHIWGTEFVHTLCMVNAVNDPDKTVISIQGLISCCGEKYLEGLPKKVIKRYTFRDLMRHDSIYEQQQKFLGRGRFEIEAIKKAGHVIGRTGWDKENVLSINPDIKYHHCREILRPEFYEGPIWTYEGCEKHSVFMSQAYYPIKGMHYAIEILCILKRSYPDVKLYTTGRGVFPDNLKNFIKQDSYSLYIKELINKYGVKEQVIYLGHLSASQMKERYLRSNVYLQASVLENSPNSLGEAMMLGVPCVASDVGGTASMIPEQSRVSLYPYDQPEKAAGLIAKIFESGKEAEENIERYIAGAAMMYDKSGGYDEYMSVYMNHNI